MAISTDAMAQILANSRKLMTGEAQGKINNAAKSDKVYESYESYDTSNYTTEIPQEYQFVQPTTNSSSKLPKAILESMMNNQIDCSCLEPDGMSSLMKKVEANIPEQPKKKKINEERIVPQTNGVIDYSLIKQIVEECIDRKLKTMNESTLKGVKLKEGKISLVDNSGNVYQAVLEYKGKAKK